MSYGLYVVYLYGIPAGCLGDVYLARVAKVKILEWTGEKVEPNCGSCYGGYMHPWYLKKSKMTFGMSDWALYNTFLVQSPFVHGAKASCSKTPASP